ncbi:hypothetical protein KOW79_019861 [Hemibagrus wyckioides]|uniref:Uncharacterized protein n=1 Tax=Hemibagrus wyckioides TaxID=337641 RepID=A0A9D3N881_9TELE|nr:hypothetical protein KOW79_019861 [Hemibagrus wyckioides]
MFLGDGRNLENMKDMETNRNTSPGLNKCHQRLCGLRASPSKAVSKLFLCLGEKNGECDSHVTDGVDERFGLVSDITTTTTTPPLLPVHCAIFTRTLLGTKSKMEPPAFELEQLGQSHSRFQPALFSSFQSGLYRLLAERLEERREPSMRAERCPSTWLL